MIAYENPLAGQGAGMPSRLDMTERDFKLHPQRGSMEEVYQEIFETPSALLEEYMPKSEAYSFVDRNAVREAYSRMGDLLPIWREVPYRAERVEAGGYAASLSPESFRGLEYQGFWESRIKEGDQLFGRRPQVLLDDLSEIPEEESGESRRERPVYRFSLRGAEPDYKGILQDVKQRHKLTGREWAQLSGIQVGSVMGYLQGRKRVRLDHLRCLLVPLGYELTVTGEELRMRYSPERDRSRKRDGSGLVVPPLGRRLREERQKREWTQQRLAEMLETSQEYVSMIELGYEWPSKGVHERLKGIFGDLPPRKA